MNVPHQVHGMSLELALPDWPVLTTDEIHRVLHGCSRRPAHCGAMA